MAIDLVVEKIYRQTQLHSIFGGQKQGGTSDLPDILYQTQ
jgi:hypothetical protein